MAIWPSLALRVRPRIEWPWLIRRLAGLTRPPRTGRLRTDLIEAVEADEPATEEETGRIKDLIAALGS